MRAITTLWIVFGTIRSVRKSLASPAYNANSSRKNGFPSALATISWVTRLPSCSTRSTERTMRALLSCDNACSGVCLAWDLSIHGGW